MLLGGASTLGALLASRARRITEQDVAQRELPHSRVHRRMDRDYWATVTTTIGTVSFPWFAYREILKNGASTPTKKAQAAQSRLFSFLWGDHDRINYIAFRARGYQISSGAMESLHRTSQLRLKLPGAKWLEHTRRSSTSV